MTLTFQQSLSRSYTVSSDLGRAGRAYQDHAAVVSETARRLDELSDDRYQAWIELHDRQRWERPSQE